MGDDQIASHLVSPSLANVGHGGPDATSVVAHGSPSCCGRGVQPLAMRLGGRCMQLRRRRLGALYGGCARTLGCSLLRLLVLHGAATGCTLLSRIFFIASRTAITTITGVLGEHATDGHVRRSWRPSLRPLLPFMCWRGRGLRPACATFQLRSASGTLVEFRGGDVVFPPLRRNCDDFT